LTPKTIRSRKPITVGGRTNGSVSKPSKIIFVFSDFIPAIHLAAKIPDTNVKVMAADAVFMEINTGESSIAYSPIPVL
jgi:hypothetical protein